MMISTQSRILHVGSRTSCAFLLPVHVTGATGAVDFNDVGITRAGDFLAPLLEKVVNCKDR